MKTFARRLLLAGVILPLAAAAQAQSWEYKSYKRTQGGQYSKDSFVVGTITLEEKDGRTLLVLHELYPSKQALDDAIASGSTGASGAPEQFELLDEVLGTWLSS